MLWQYNTKYHSHAHNKIISMQMAEFDDISGLLTTDRNASATYDYDTECYDVNSIQMMSASRPLRTLPVDGPSNISKGDHILYQVNSTASCRAVYRSALIENISASGNISIITYTPKGVQCHDQQFHLFKSLHRVDYTASAFTGKEAVERARQRVGECHYHGLFNNSHHFVTRVKTGQEYSLADLIHGAQGEYIICMNCYYHLTLT